MLGINSIIKTLNMIYEHVEDEYLDENKVKQDLMRIRLKYEMEEMDYEEYLRQEKNLMQRIIDIREHKKQLIEDEGDDDNE